MIHLHCKVKQNNVRRAKKHQTNSSKPLKHNYPVMAQCQETGGVCCDDNVQSCCKGEYRVVQMIVCKPLSKVTHFTVQVLSGKQAIVNLERSS